MALIITSAATVVYATLTYLLLRETRREKKKPIIEEILGVVLYPLKYFLNEECIDFKKSNARLSFIKGKFRVRVKLSNLYSWGATTLVYENFRRSHTNIAELMDKHDALVTELENKADAVVEVLYTPKFRRKCRDAVNKWDEKAEDHRKISKAFEGCHLPEDLFTYTVNSIDDLPEGHFARDFWRGNHKIFFKEKERFAKRQCDDLENTIKELSSFTENLLAETNKLIEKYQKKYGISAKHVTDKYETFKFDIGY